MKKVVLVIPPIDDRYSHYGKEFDWGWWQPVGLLSLASYLKKHEVDTDILVMDEQMFSFAEIENKIKNFAPDWLGVSPTPFTYENSLKLAELGKQIGSRVVFGGHHATSRADQILKNRKSVDYVVIEDGEDALLGIVKGERLMDIPNLAWRDSGVVIMNKTQWPPLDRLPPLDYSLVDIEAYFRQYAAIQKESDPGQPFRRPLAVYAQKGCRWREKKHGGCIYCSCIYPQWRGKDPRLVWREIMSYQDRYNIDGLIFTEDDFISNFRWLDLFYKNRPQAAPGIRFMFTRADSITKKTVETLRKLNCYQVYLGIESGDNGCLRAMNKGVSVGRILKSARMLNERGIKFVASFVLGAPGESPKSLDNTWRLANDLAGLGASHFTAYPLVPTPGSKAWTKITGEDEEFHCLFADEDNLDVSEMAFMWINKYCRADLELISAACDRINKLCFTYRKPTDGWLQ